MYIDYLNRQKLFNILIVIFAICMAVSIFTNDPVITFSSGMLMTFFHIEAKAARVEILRNEEYAKSILMKRYKRKISALDIFTLILTFGVGLLAGFMIFGK